MFGNCMCILLLLKRTNYFVAMSFCHEEFYSSTVIERHLCQTLHSSSVKEE